MKCRRIALVVFFAASAMVMVFVTNAAWAPPAIPAPLPPEDWTQLTDSTSKESDPDWHPDSTRIAYYFRPGWSADIYTMNAEDGSDKIQVTQDGGIEESPEYSPDGQKVLFWRYHNDSWTDILIRDLTTGAETLLLEADYAQDPVWSPDGSEIAFPMADNLDGAYQIYKTNADGTGLTQLTFDGWFNVGAAWSPDGSTIMFTSDRDGQYKNEVRHIYFMDADGSNQRRISDPAAFDSHPAWSPCGQYIVYSDESMHLNVMTTDGTHVGQLTDSNSTEFLPDWSPDGTRITFVSKVNGNYDIFVVPFDLDIRPPPGEWIAFTSARTGVMLQLELEKRLL